MSQAHCARVKSVSRTRQRHGDDEVLVFGTFTEAAMCLILPGNIEHTHRGKVSFR